MAVGDVVMGNRIVHEETIQYRDPSKPIRTSFECLVKVFHRHEGYDVGPRWDPVLKKVIRPNYRFQVIFYRKMDGSQYSFNGVYAETMFEALEAIDLMEA